MQPLILVLGLSNAAFSVRLVQAVRTPLKYDSVIYICKIVVEDFLVLLTVLENDGLARSGR